MRGCWRHGRFRLGMSGSRMQAEPAGIAAGQATVSSGSMRATPGFVRQCLWCLARAVLQRTRGPLSIFIDYMIFAITGASELCPRSQPLLSLLSHLL